MALKHDDKEEEDEEEEDEEKEEEEEEDVVDVVTPIQRLSTRSPWSSLSAQWTSAASCRNSSSRKDPDAQTPPDQ